MTKNVPSKQVKQLRPLNWGDERTSVHCEKAAVILDYTYKTASSLLKTYMGVRESRSKTGRGTSTDQEQDLLRAMLVMAAAGLDGMAKQLIRDCVPPLIDKDDTVRKGLETFISRRIRGVVDDSDASSGAKFIARLLSVQSQQGQAIEEYTLELTGGSLQSVDELLHIGAAFGLDPTNMRLSGARKKNVKEIFDIRNKIIHELDMNLQKTGRGRRRRNQRREEDMIEYVNSLLMVGSALIKEVYAKISDSTN